MSSLVYHLDPPTRVVQTDAANSGLETGRKDSTSYVLIQDKIRLVLTATTWWATLNSAP